MFKNIFITLVILTLALNANDKELNTEGLSPVEVCEKVYDDCSDKCEKSKEINIEKCFEQCEVLYEECILTSEQKLKAK